MDRMRASLVISNLAWLVTIILALGLIFSHLGHNVVLRASDELVHAEQMVSAAAHSFAIRGECNDSAPMFASAVDAVTALGLTGSITASHVVRDSQTGESVPVSTQTALSTIYSVVSSSPEVTSTSTSTRTKTGTVTVTHYPVPEYTAASENSCQTVVTETVYVTVYPDATVTAGASTLTNVNSQVSYTSGLPDVTLSGNPSTLTAVQTDVSFTSGAPDATISGNPSTVTNFRTDVSVTTGLPDVTVSGEASTFTDVQVSWRWSLSTTYLTAVTTVTISDLWPPSANSEASSVEVPQVTTVTITPSAPSSSGFISSEVAGDATSLPAGSPTSTYTEIVTATGGPPVVQITTVDVFPPAYSDSSYNSTSTVAAAVSATWTSSSIGETVETSTATSSATESVVTPIIISDGSKRPEPRGGGRGISNLACTVMLIAVIMFMF
ncbi:hypothetical protein AAL_00587 [Moelleriella libera RCEF 2490]|uniref:Uncharacterized protein n=1 Tax=Moelleriella libera RCEF 2490 TaxID=1081109 RepID=A0A166UYY3_9HYPO|nr:hypothetical protein AAL_00587 [Moelleriella libera RCEF 2490]